MIPINKLREMGFNLMPLQKESKAPVLSSWLKLVDEQYEGKFPEGCNVAIICGTTSNNLFVVDLDDSTLYDDFEFYHGVTFTVKTSKGYHFYFRNNGLPIPGRKLVDKRGRPVDIKSHGGYVIAPGSIHPDTKKPYEIICDKPVLTIDPNEIKDFLEKLGFDIKKRSFDEIEQGVSEGGRNDSTFSYGCYLVREGVYGEALKIELEKLNNKHKPPLPQKDIDILYTQITKAENRKIKIHMKNVERIQDRLKVTPVKMQDIRPELHEGFTIQFDCMITAVGERMTYTKNAEFECYECGDSVTKKCNELYQMVVPTCKTHGTKRIINHSTKETGYIQQLRIQEFLEDSKHSSPIEFDAEILDDGVGEAFMGDRKTVTAKFRSIPNKSGYNTIVFEIINMDNMEQGEGCMPDKKEIEKWENNKNLFEDVTNSIVPELLFSPLILKSLILYAAGGTTLNGKRDSINAALIGDAQLAKSEVLERFHILLPGSGFTVGMRTSGAGLTIGMVKLHNGMSVPKAGWFPLHTNHHCIFDEGDKLKPEDQDACLEVMEQQTVTLVKNGVPGIRLPAKCPLLFAGNPKGSKFNKKLSIMDNFNMSVPFVSRFDFVFCIVDSNDPVIDQAIRECIKSFQDRKAEYMTIEELQRYFTYIGTINSKVPKSLYYKIDELHIKMRKLNKLDSLPIGVRQYHGLFRLITACASAHLREEATIHDVMIVEKIINASFKSMRMDLDSGEQTGSIVPKKETKETVFLEVWTACKDIQGEVGREEFIENLGKRTPYNPLTAPVEFNKWWKDFGRIELVNETERFKMVNI